MIKNNSLWITWEHQIRNKSMSARIGAEYVVFAYNGNALFRYMQCSWKTFVLLFKNRGKGKTVFVQNPSIVLSFIAVLCKKILAYRVVVDAHNSGVFPRRELQFIADFINRHADYVIVTNQGLAAHVTALGGCPVILPDPLPDVSVQDALPSPWGAIPRRSVMAICSWASDEPYVEIIGAAALLPNVQFYITGNSKGRESAYGQSLPPNVVLTGYISDNDYHVLLKTAGVVLDLTTRDDCLVCGAYEAISACKPVVLSDTQALRAYFDPEASFVANEASAIALCLKGIFAEYEKFSARAVENMAAIESRWQERYRKFLSVVYAD